ncbi:MAG: hypothetical protein ACRDIY_19135, partial [Chloroflexota bacterium]
AAGWLLAALVGAAAGWLLEALVGAAAGAEVGAAAGAAGWDAPHAAAKPEIAIARVLPPRKRKAERRENRDDAIRKTPRHFVARMIQVPNSCHHGRRFGALPFH